MISLLTGALLTGLAGAPHCAAMCGGFAAATATRPAEGLAWQAGRLTTYTLLGAVAGTIGDRIAAPGLVGQVIVGGLLVVFCAQLAGFVHLPALLPERLIGPASRLLRKTGVPARYGLGLLTGLLPCGVVYAAVGLAMLSGGALQGMAVMAAFGLSTVPALAAAAVLTRRLLSMGPLARPLLAGAVLLLGLSTVAARGPVPVDEPPACHEAE